MKMLKHELGIIAGFTSVHYKKTHCICSAGTEQIRSGGSWRILIHLLHGQIFDFDTGPGSECADLLNSYIILVI